MRTCPAGVGLYSIGIRGATVPEIAAWAARHEIPFLHLRGGARGCAATQQTEQELDRWRAIADATTPITVLTADLTLHDLTQACQRRRAVAACELARTVAAAARLGARMIRILASASASASALDDAATIVAQLPERDMTFLIEPHDPSWWTPAGVDRLQAVVQLDSRVRVLADTGQAAAGFANLCGATATAVADRALAMSAVVHLSDNGTSLSAGGHALLAQRAGQLLAAGGSLEVAFEWTGAERTRQVCLDRYRSACAWWQDFGIASDEGGLR